MKRINQQSGFSLVELMVVVAIIGILATVAIPRVNKFIAKSRTSEAQVNLSSIYTFNKNFYVEFSGYTTDFGTMGYHPEGRLRYNIGWTNNAGAPAGYAAAGKVYAATGSNTLALCVSMNPGPWPCLVLPGATNVAPPAAIPGTTIAGNFSTFTAGAIAQLLSGGPTDQWTITDSKNLRNTVDGTQ